MLASIKKYSFLIMMVVTSFAYGGMRLYSLYDEHLEQVALEDARRAEYVESIGEAIVGALGGSDSIGGQAAGLVAEVQTSQDGGSGTQGLGGAGAAGADGGAGGGDGTGSQGLGAVGTDGGTGMQGGEVPFQRVELDYLDDALFIGDSRTDTLHLYAGWDKTDFFVKSGLSVWEVLEEVLDDGVTLDGMLSAKQYGKIYIMLGINELGRGTPKTYAEQFGVVVDHVREMQPDAVIFVGSIIHVTPGKDAENTYINNAEIDARNEELVKLTDNQSVFWLDANEVLDDPATGKLREDYAFDGVHLKAKYIPVWQEFFLDHGIVK